MRAFGFLLLRLVLQLTAVVASALMGGVGLGWGSGAWAIATAAIGPIWMRRCPLRARLMAYLLGLLVGGVVPLAIVAGVATLGRHQVVSGTVVVIVAVPTLAFALLAGVAVPIRFLRRWRRRAAPAIA